MSRSTFSGFTIAHLGMNASQMALQVTGQNISNINTAGYTRQQVDLVSLNLNGSNAVATGPTSKIGYGVSVSNISQVRDPFLDVLYRNQIAKLGTSDAQQAVIDQLSDIFDETDKDALGTALTNLSSSLQKMSADASSDEYDSIIRSRFQVILNFVHQKADDLSTARENAISSLETTDIPKLNNLLSDISELNNSIWNSQVQGNPALELKDQRNSKLDELASYLPISVTYKSVTVATDATYEYPVVKFEGSNGEVYNLTAGQHGENCASLEAEPQDDGKVKILLTPATDYAPGTDISALTTEITDNLKDGTIKGTADMLNKSGELDDPATDFRGIGYYEKVLNSFVQTLAKTFNDLNIDAAGKTEADPTGIKNYALFTSTDGSSNLTAENIKISDDWMNGIIGLIASDGSGGSTDNSNILKMYKALESGDTKFEYQSPSGSPITFFTGSYYNCYYSISGTLGIDSAATTATLKNHMAVLGETADNRDSVSGVSLDEETIGLMQYQKSYTAAARLMTTLDEALDVLINKTGVVGR